MFKMITISDDGTAKDFSGNILFFPIERFQREICQNGHCFICGSEPNDNFNREHIIPKWVLKSCNIYNKAITLPNGETTLYSKYTLQCCKECNSILGQHFEDPVRKIFSNGFDAVESHINNHGPQLIQLWLSLIFLKTHLKDFRLKLKLDDRIDSGKIGDQYDLGDLHHIHALARARASGIEIDDNVFGSLLIFKTQPSHCPTTYDYCDNFFARTIYLRIKDTAIISVIDDCGATNGMLSKQLDTIPNPINEIQLREIFARYAAANVHVQSKPTFGTMFATKSGKPRIKVETPDLEIFEYNPNIFGKFFFDSLGEYRNKIIINGLCGEDIYDLILEGKVSVLFDDQFKPVTFQSHSLDPDW